MPSSSSSPAPVHVAVLGAGIVGLSSAYYTLTSPDLPPGSTVTLIDNTRQNRVAPGASSQAGGFIGGGDGQSWVNALSLDLARLSFACHKQLAEEVLDGARQYGWYECGATGLTVGTGDEKRSAYRNLPQGEKATGVDKSRDWLNGERETLPSVGCAQVDPKEFCETLHRFLATKPNFRTIFGEPLALTRQSSTSQSLRVQPHNSASPIALSLTKLVLAAGPWTAPLCETLSLPRAPISNLPGHSLLVRPALPPHLNLLPIGAVFAGINGADGGVHQDAARQLTAEEIAVGFTPAPEFFPRANGVVYVAGENAIPATGTQGELPHKLPRTVDGVKEIVDPKLIERLSRAAGLVSPTLDVAKGAKIEVEQFCYRPISPDGDPIIDFLVPGVVLACGHGPWGISLAPGTGKVVSELVLNGRAKSANIAPLSLGRFAKAKL